MGLLRRRLSAEMLQTLTASATNFATKENPKVYKERNASRYWDEREGHQTKAFHCGALSFSLPQLFLFFC